ncbi:hypothetical protein IscW_ISCW009807, partial [Ixodes scapularis]
KFYESMIDKGRVDPCEDFYSHVCEKWNRNARIPPFSRKYSFDDWIVSDIEKTIYTEVEVEKQLREAKRLRSAFAFSLRSKVTEHVGAREVKTAEVVVGQLPYMLEEPETTALPKFILSTTESSNWLRQSVCDAMLTSSVTETTTNIRDVIYNYLGYRVLLRLGLLYRTHENHVKTLYYRYHLGYKTEPERWRLCLRYAERSMPMAASWIYHMWIKKKFGLKGDKLWIKFFNVYRKLYESIDYSYAYSYLTTADARVEAYRKLKDVRVQLFFINATMTDPLLNLYGGQLNANATVNEDMIDVAVITPLLRFYRKMIYEKAYPFPDYRLSGLHHVSSDQLFFYSLAESFCEKTSREAAEELIQNGTFSPMKYRREQPEEPVLTFGDLIPPLPSASQTVNVEEEVGSIAAERIMQSVNKSTVGPCEDFYSYVCHGWLRENPILAGASKTSHNLELKERIEASLSAFIEENIDNVGMKPLKRVLADLGLRDWPTVRATEPKVEVVAGRVTRDLGESTLFAISVGTVRSKCDAFQVDQPELSIRRGHLLGNARNLEAYRKVIKSAMALTKPEENLEGLAGEVMNLVHRISRSTKTPKERLKIGTHFLRERLDSLQAKTRWNWSNFLNTILEGVTTVRSKGLIRVRSPFYIGHMSRILNTVARQATSTVFNLVGFQVALTLSPLLAERARSVARLRLRRRFESNGESTTRQKMCLHLAQDAMPLVALHTYKVVFSKLYSPSIEKARTCSHFTVSNTYRNWWSEETQYRYAQVQSCFMEQYKTIVDRKLHLR